MRPVLWVVASPGDSGGAWAGLTPEVTSLVCLALAHVPLATSAYRLAATLSGGSAKQQGFAARLLLAAVLYFSAMMAVGLILGMVGILTCGWIIAGAALAAGVLWWASVRLERAAAALDPAVSRPLEGSSPAGVPHPGSARPHSTAILALGAGLVMLVGLTVWQAFAKPTYDYDVLTYHLVFPARWFQDAAITIIPTWFGDPAPAYAPSSIEVWYATLICCLGDDRLARGGQVAFWLQWLLAVYVAVRALAVRRWVAMGACLALAAVPAPQAQAASAMVDVALAAHLTTVVGFALRRGHSRRPADLVGLILSAGLLMGTKFTAVVFLVAVTPLVAWMAGRSGLSMPRPSGRIVAAAVLVAAWCGGFWYVRNWAVTGNPVYPLEVRAGSLRLFPGAFGTEQMSNSPFNVRRSGTEDAFGRILWESLHPPQSSPPMPDAAGTVPEYRRWYAGPVGLIAAAALLSAWAALRRRPADLAVLTALGSTAAAWAAFWYVLPFQEGRFAWGPIALTLVCGAAASRVHPSAGRVLAAATGAVWVGAFLGDWSLPWSGLVASGAAVAEVISVTLICAAAAGWRFHTRGSRANVPTPGVGWVACVSTAACLTASVIAGLAGDSPRKEAIRSPRWRFQGPAWEWVDRHLRNATIAYTGHNVPYFLLGSKLSNRVIYVPARRPAEGRYHDFASLPATRAMGPPHLPGPACDRFVMDPSIWLENLQAAGVHWILVSPLFPHLLPTHRHDDDGFPVEREWLDALGEVREQDRRFATCRAFEEGGSRLYELDWTVSLPVRLPLRHVKQQETDALARILIDRIPPGRPVPDYPHAAAYLERYGLRPRSSTGMVH